MQWIDDTRTEEDTPKGGEFNAKEDKEIISLHQKYAFFLLSQPFLSSLSLGLIFELDSSLLGIRHTLCFILKYYIYNPKP